MFYVFLLLSTTFTLFSSCFAEENKTLSVGDKIYSPTECYTILKDLGEGAFGKVYQVEDSQGQHFAIKSYKQQDDEWMQKSLLADAEREYLRGQLLEHPHIIKTFEMFSYQVPGQQISTNLVLQFVPGETLFDTERKSISKKDAVGSALALCEALDYALILNLVHIDLHYGNIMVENHKSLMVIDLASFYSLDELLTFVDTHKTLTKEKTVKDISVRTVKSAPAHSSSEVEGKKIQAFFQQHPQIFWEMKEIRQRNASYRARSLNHSTKVEDHLNLSVCLEPFFNYYFMNICDACFYLISKADVAKEEKLLMWSEIMKLEWSYLEDFSEGLSPSIQDYLTQLKAILHAFR